MAAGLVSVTPADKAVFLPEELLRGIRSELRVTNIRGVAVNYKVRTTAPELYSIQPAKGVIQPASSLTILIQGTGIEAPRPMDRFQLIATLPETSPVEAQTIILGCRMLPSAEYMTMKSMASGGIGESLGGRETLEERRLVRELKAECEDREREVEELRRKVRVLEAGVFAHHPALPSKSPPSGFSNTSLLLCFLLGLLLSSLLPTL